MSRIRLSSRFRRRNSLLAAAAAFVIGLTAPAGEAMSHQRAAIGGKANSDRPRSASRAIAAIEAGLERCYAANYPAGPQDMEACHSKAIHAFDALLQPSRHKEFDGFLLDISDPLIYFLTKGDDALAMHVVVSGSQKDLARERAAILTGAGGRPPRARRNHQSLNQLLGKVHGDPRMGQFHYGQHLLRHWVSVRNADCAAHAVPHCAERLDAALADVLERIFSAK
jgi:hypothetical protein